MTFSAAVFHSTCEYNNTRCDAGGFAARLLGHQCHIRQPVPGGLLGVCCRQVGGVGGAAHLATTNMRGGSIEAPNSISRVHGDQVARVCSPQACMRMPVWGSIV
jgi:hypothetical protein